MLVVAGKVLIKIYYQIQVVYTKQRKKALFSCAE